VETLQRQVLRARLLAAQGQTAGALATLDSLLAQKPQAAAWLDSAQQLKNALLRLQGQEQGTSLDALDSLIAAQQANDAASECAALRKTAADKFSASRKTPTLAHILIGDAIAALDRCLALNPAPDLKKKVEDNKAFLQQQMGPAATEAP
jgi:hypothetical protein